MSDAPRQEEEQATQEPCVLFGFWPERECPNEEEIRLAIESTFGAVKELQELDPTDDSPWGRVIEIRGIDEPVMIWAEERGELPDELVKSWIDDEEERREAAKSSWLIGVRSQLDPKRPAHTLHDLMRVLAAASVPGLPAVYDDGALCVLSGRSVRELASSVVPPRNSALYAIHNVPGRGGSWLHTHGLARAGIPEIELLAVPGDDHREACELIDAVVDALLGNVEPDSDGVMELGESIRIRIMDAEEALTRFPADIAGGRDGRGDHDLKAWILLAEDGSGSPRDAIARMAEDVVLFKTREESDRQRSLSQHRFSVFGQLFALRRGCGWQFHIKLAYERASESTGSEYMWFEALALRPGEVLAKLLSVPRDVPALSQGSESWHSLERMADWVIVTPDGSFDPENAGVLLED